MEKSFQGFVETTFSFLKQTYGKPTLENERASWIITINDKEYEIYDYLPLESSSLNHKWRVDSEFTDLSHLIELFKN